jgi:hypothetical protein
VDKEEEMNIDDISSEIVKIRGRLREIEEERKGLSEDDLAAKTALHDEEIELRARLAELQEMTTAGGGSATTAMAK